MWKEAPWGENLATVVHLVLRLGNEREGPERECPPVVGGHNRDLTLLLWNVLRWNDKAKPAVPRLDRLIKTRLWYLPPALTALPREEEDDDEGGGLAPHSRAPPADPP